MGNLRARHWLAGITALAVLGVGWGLTSSGGDDDAVATEIERDTLGSVPSDDTTVAGVEAEADPEPDRLALDEELADDAVDEVEPSGPVAPFTGLPADAETLARSALVVKVDNHPRARPQTGLDQADIVFDLRAEGVTRFAAVFHSQVPDPVGPVRSSRTSDFDLLRGLDNPLYASSGANDYVASGLRSLPIVELTNRTRGEYFPGLRSTGAPQPIRQRHRPLCPGPRRPARAPTLVPVSGRRGGAAHNRNPGRRSGVGHLHRQPSGHPHLGRDRRRLAAHPGWRPPSDRGWRSAGSGERRDLRDRLRHQPGRPDLARGPLHRRWSAGGADRWAGDRRDLVPADGGGQARPARRGGLRDRLDPWPDLGCCCPKPGRSVSLPIR